MIDWRPVQGEPRLSPTPPLGQAPAPCDTYTRTSDLDDDWCGEGDGDRQGRFLHPSVFLTDDCIC